MEPEPGSIAGLPSFPPILWLKLPFSFVKRSSRLTLRLYVKYSAHLNILLGTHELQMPLEDVDSQSGLFYWDFSLFNRLNITRVDIACVLENDVGNIPRSIQPTTLHIKVKITPPTLNNSPPSLPTEDDDSPAHEATLPGRIQSTSPERPLSLQPVEAGNDKPQSREGELPAGTKDLPLDLRPADEAMERIDRSNTCQGVVRRIKWVMDTLGPIVEVRVITF